MSRCHQHLRQDLLTLQSSVRELLGKSKKIQVPSWRFPEKLASEVDVETALTTSHNEAVEGSALLLLELTIDR